MKFKSQHILCIFLPTFFACTFIPKKTSENLFADSLNMPENSLPEFIDLSLFHTPYLYGANFHGIFEYKLLGDTAGDLFQYIEIDTKLEKKKRTTSFNIYDYYLKPSNAYKEEVKDNIVKLLTYIIFEPDNNGTPKPAVADSLVALPYRLKFPVKDTLRISFRFDSPSQPDFYAVFNDKNWVGLLEKSTWKNREVPMLIMMGNFKFTYKQKHFTYNNEMNCSKTYYYAQGIGLVRYSFKCDDGRNNTYELNRIISPKEFQEMQLNPPIPPLPEPDTSPSEMIVPLNK